MSFITRILKSTNISSHLPWRWWRRSAQSQVHSKAVIFKLLCPFFPVLTTCVYSTTVLQPRPSSSFVRTPHSLWTISNHPPSLPLGKLLWICRKTFISCLHLVEKPEKPQLGKANEYKIDKVRGGECEIRFSRIFFFNF